MTNKDVVIAFIRGESVHTGHMTSTGDRLFSYNTCIAQWHKGTLLVNRTKYSSTTSHQMSHLNRMLQFDTGLKNLNVINIAYARINTQNLTDIFDDSKLFQTY